MSSITTEYIDPATGKKVKPQRAVGTANTYSPTDSIIAAAYGTPTPDADSGNTCRAVKRNGLHQRRERSGYVCCTSAHRCDTCGV